MCLNIKKHAIKRIATKNIIVYKQLCSYEIDGRKYYITPYQKANVVIGETYSSELIKDCKWRTVDEGLHSFANIPDCYDNSRHTASSFNIDGEFRITTPVLVECFIPKGARFYRGTFNGGYESLASNKLVYNRILGFNQ